MGLRHWWAAAGLAVLVGCGSAIVNPVTGEAERSVMSEEQELEQGAQAHAQVLSEYGVVQAPALQAYVQALGQRLAQQSHREQLKWRFTVLDSPEINAFALPGGYVYVTRGILAYLDSEAELAGVLGHEIGHVTARHGAQRATKQSDAALGVLAASVLGAVLEGYGVSGAGRLASDVSQTVAAGNIAAYGREQELQADALGAEYLSRVRYDPRTMVDVIRVLKAQERFAADQARQAGRNLPAARDWLASHPSNDERLGRISELSAQYRSDKPYEDEGRARFHTALAGLTFGDSAAQGLERGASFYHPTLGFAMDIPPHWRLSNDAEQLAVVAPKGDAAVLLRTVPDKLARDPQAILRAMVQPSQGRTESLQLHGLSATRLTGARGKQRLEATVVQGPGAHWYLLQFSAGSDTAWGSAWDAWRALEASFRPLSDADRAKAKEWVLRSVPLPAGGFAELARTSPLPQAEARLRLLNGYYEGGGTPRTGQMVKVVALRP